MANELDGIDDITEILAKQQAQTARKPKLPGKSPVNTVSTQGSSPETFKSSSLFGSKFAHSPKKTFDEKIHPKVQKISDLSQQLWVDKYAPKCQNDLAGNRTVIENFEKWLRDWNDVILKGMKKPMPVSKGRKDLPNVNAKTCLISGPPGIGKSSTARIIAKKLGFHVMEMNASDARSKNRIEELLRDFSKSGSIACKFN